MRALVPCLLALLACQQSTRAESHEAPKPVAEERAKPKAAPEPAALRPPPPATSGYAVPERSEAELAQVLDDTCRQAAERGRPWLIEVTAPWCADCRALAALEKQPVLAQELARWPRAQVNIGNFDRHGALRKWLGVHSIAQWSVLEPRVCEPALGHAPVVVQRTLEPRSGVPVDAASLAQWLADARTAWQSP